MSNLQTEVMLPSKGKLYSNKFWSKPVVMSMIDSDWEKKIYGGSRGPDIIDEMLQELIQGEANIDELHPSDKFFLMMKLRIHSYGPDYHTECKCPICGENEVEVNLDNVNVVEMPEDFEITASGVLPINGDTVETKVLMSGDYKKIRRRVKKMCTGTAVKEREQEYITTNAARIVKINGEEVQSSQKEKYFSELVARDSLALRKLSTRPKFGYADTVRVVCPKCGDELEAPLIMTGEFFRPRLD